MATKPFKLVTTSPADTDIVSVFPSLDRGDKDIVQSWLLTDHNVDGTHTQATLVQVGTLLSDGTTTTVAPTPASGRSAIYRDTDGGIKLKKGDDNSVDFMGGVPPGVVVFTAARNGADTPGLTSPGTGIYSQWLYCAGQAVSRTTFARLFNQIGGIYGNGDGSTTFNVPDLQARQIIGEDGLNGTSGRISAAGGNFDATSLGNSGGQQRIFISQAMLPNVNFNITDNGHQHTTQFQSILGLGGGGGNTALNYPGTAANAVSQVSTTGITVNSGGSGSQVPVVDPSLVLIPIIRT